MVKIKLARLGKKNQAIYRIVVSEARKKRDGKNIESIGSYNPKFDPPKISLKKDRYLYWLEKGAQPTKTVVKITKKYR